MEEKALDESESEGLQKKPVASAKKPRSKAQIEAFEKARAKRIENAKLKKEAIDDVKQKVKTRKDGENPFVESVKVEKKKPVQKPKIEEPEESSDEEEEIVIKQVKKPKKKKRVITVVQSETDSEEEEERPPARKSKQSRTISQPQLQPGVPLRFIY